MAKVFMASVNMASVIRVSVIMANKFMAKVLWQMLLSPLPFSNIRSPFTISKMGNILSFFFI